MRYSLIGYRNRVLYSNYIGFALLEFMLGLRYLLEASTGKFVLFGHHRALLHNFTTVV